MLQKDAIEIVELRTAESKTFENLDGSRTTIIFGRIVHELNKDKGWDELDPYLYTTYSTNVTIKYTGDSYRLPIGSEPQFTVGKTQTTVDRGFIFWDTHIIGTGANIIECKFNIPNGSTNGGTAPSYNLVKLDDNPKLTWPTPPELELQDRWEKIGSATTAYFSNINGVYYQYFTSNESQNSEFKEDLESRLADNWMAVGIKNTNELSASNLLNFTSTSYALAVSYWPSSAHYKFRASPLNTSVAPGGGTVPISFSNEGALYLGVLLPIEYELTSTLPSWLSVDANTGITPSAWTFTALTNSGTTPRSATIHVEAVNPPSGVQNSVRTIIINQGVPYPAVLSVNDPLWQSSEYGGTKAIYVTNSGNSTPLNYEVQGTASWLWLTGLTGANNNQGTTNSTFTIHTLPNYTGAFRYLNLHIVSGSLFTDVEVRQNPASNITLPGQQNSGQQTYYATDWISAGNFTVGTGGNVSSLTLRAGNKIILSPGFTARSDAGNFNAYIQSFGEDNLELTIKEEDKKILSLKKSDSKNSKTPLNGEEANNKTQTDAIPTEYNLFQNYPNPFNPTTIIKFALPEKDIVKISIYNQIGQEIAEIVNTELNTGFYTVNFNGSSLASGIYFYRIVTAKYSKTLKLLLIK
ncbi:MAG: T9SS type A sorting domain-containing protein [Ignavibacteria bacterium]|nr:T9SS type A sorting domain-containing protein [Ignavibacteria bacterium]